MAKISHMYVIYTWSNGVKTTTATADMKTALRYLSDWSDTFGSFEVEIVEVMGNALSDTHGIYCVEYMRQDGSQYEQAYFTDMQDACLWVTGYAKQNQYDVHSITEVPVYCA